MSDDRDSVAVPDPLDDDLRWLAMPLDIGGRAFAQIVLESLIIGSRIAFFEHDFCKVNASGQTSAAGFQFFERHIDAAALQIPGELTIPFATILALLVQPVRKIRAGLARGKVRQRVNIAVPPAIQSKLRVQLNPTDQVQS